MREALMAWLRRELGHTRAILADQDGPPLERQYATLKIGAIRYEGQPTTFPIGDNGLQPILQGAMVTVNVNVFGGSVGQAFDTAMVLAKSLSRFTVKQQLRVEGLAFVRLLSDPKDISMPVGTTYESRALLEMQFRTNVRTDDNLDWIERVELTGNYQSDGPGFQTTQIIGV